MFEGCINLTVLSDISKWDIKNIIEGQFIFDNCLSLIVKPDIEKYIKNNN